MDRLREDLLRVADRLPKLSGADTQFLQAEVERALRGVNVIDENNLNDIMLTSADPNEAVAYFQRTLVAIPVG